LIFHKTLFLLLWEGLTFYINVPVVGDRLCAILVVVSGSLNEKRKNKTNL